MAQRAKEACVAGRLRPMRPALRSSLNVAPNVNAHFGGFSLLVSKRLEAASSP